MSHLNPGRPEASAVIWAWEETTELSQSGASTSSLRVRGIIQGLVGGSIAGLFWYFGLQTMAMVAGGIAGFLTIVALISPRVAFAAIQRIFQTFGGWVGSGVTWIVLPAIFYGFFLPFGALFRRSRRDTMKRFFEDDKESYWEERSEMGARTRQF
jgi:hypothetical protein